MKQREIDKLEAARIQIEVAIRIFFERKDSIAVHTLATAAQGILMDIGKSMGITSTIFNEEYIRPEKKKEFMRIVREPQNFFKHADKDPDEKLNYRDFAAALMLFDVCLLYQSISGISFIDLPEMSVFYSWMLIKNPNYIKEGPVKVTLLELTSGINADDYDFFLETIHKIKTLNS